ncbi:MAG: hypothetical protein ABI193_23640 [Minicystis sp.]
MKRVLLVALATCLALLALLRSSPASAGVPYQVQWLATQEDPSCETADLTKHDGEPFFRVNDTPLPTFQIPGALVTNPDGSQSNTAVAGFDSVLLATGENRFLFQATNESGDNSCVHSRNLVTLVSDQLGLHKTLFDVRRDGTAFSGSTGVDLRLEEINPQLARDLADLEVQLAKLRQKLINNASKIEGLAAKLDAFDRLDAELQKLATRPLDEIAKTDLDAILDRYADLLDETTKAALRQFLDDLKKSVEELQAELANLIDVFDGQAEAVADLVTQSAEAGGFNPDDPANYALGAGEIPSVEVPDISDVPGAFDPGNDPYATYAASVIAALALDVDGGKVTGRAGFVATVRAWRANDKALGEAIKARAMVSQAETNAFTNAHNSVVSYLQAFMDASGWLKDASASPVLRAYVDGVLKQGFAGLSEEMKDHLNLRSEDTIDLSETQLFKTITAFGGAMSTLGDGVQAYADVMQTLVTATSRIGVGFVPFVGPALDLCECVTGREWCLPDGKELSTEQRIFAGAGVAIGGVAHYWAGVKAAGVSPAATAIAAKVAKFDEALAQGLHANPRTWYKTLEAAADSKPLNAFEIVAGRSMQEQGRALIGIGDNGVRDVLKMKASDRAADFLAVTKGGKLAVSEAKGAAATVDAEHALSQLTSTMEALAKKGLAEDVERVEIIMKNGVPFKDPKFGVKDGYLINKLTGKTVEIEGFHLLFVKVVQL